MIYNVVVEKKLKDIESKKYGDLTDDDIIFYFICGNCYRSKIPENVILDIKRGVLDKYFKGKRLHFQGWFLLAPIEKFNPFTDIGGGVGDIQDIEEYYDGDLTTFRDICTEIFKPINLSVEINEFKDAVLAFDKLTPLQKLKIAKYLASDDMEHFELVGAITCFEFTKDNKYFFQANELYK